MKVVLKNTKTEKYLAQPGTWTENLEAAKAFSNEDQAREYFTFRKLPNVTVVKLAEPGDAEVPASKPVRTNKTARQKMATMAPEQLAKPELQAVAFQPAKPAGAVPIQSAGETKEKLTQGNVQSPRNPEVKRPTVVEATVDVGFGNAVYIRGQGAGLSWERGQPLNCTDDNKWVWSSDAARDTAIFKLLLNDQVWAQGEDLAVEPGKRVAVRPAF